MTTTVPRGGASLLPPPLRGQAWPTCWATSWRLVRRRAPGAPCAGKRAAHSLGAVCPALLFCAPASRGCASSGPSTPDVDPTGPARGAATVAPPPPCVPRPDVAGLAWGAEAPRRATSRGPGRVETPRPPSTARPAGRGLEPVEGGRSVALAAGRRTPRRNPHATRRERSRVPSSDRPCAVRGQNASWRELPCARAAGARARRPLGRVWLLPSDLYPHPPPPPPRTNPDERRISTKVGPRGAAFRVARVRRGVKGGDPNCPKMCERPVCAMR